MASTRLSKREQQQLNSELWRAARVGNTERAVDLLSRGAQPNGLDWRGWTALHWTCRNNNPALTRILLSNKADPNIPNVSNNTPLHNASYCDSLHCIPLLVEAGCDTGLMNKDGLTPLGQAVQGDRMKIVLYFLNELQFDPQGVVDRDGHSLLELAVREKKWTIIEHLILQVKVDSKGVIDRDGYSLLELAVRGEEWPIIEHLVIQVKVDPKGVVGRDGHSLLELAVREKKWTIIEHLVLKVKANPKGVVDKDGHSLLELAVHKKKWPIIEHLVLQVKVDPKDVMDGDGRNLLELAVVNGQKTIAEYLIKELKFDLKGVLLLACKHGHEDIVHFLVAGVNCDPNISDENGQTPLSLARNNDMIRFLLQHGASSAKAYELHRKCMGKVFSKNPLENPVMMFITGLGGDGKSTLIEAMEHEPTLLTPLKNFFVAPKEVDGVSQRTAGIVPKVFHSGIFGPVQFFDFAGQETYYSSHAALMRSSVSNCPPIFILVTGMHRDQDTLSHSVSYWLGMIQNQCTSMEGKAPLLIVGSHDDVRIKNGEDADAKKNLILQCASKFSLFEIVDFVLMDCRYSNSDGMKKFRLSVSKVCAWIRERLSVSLNAHQFQVFLLDRFRNVDAVTLKEVQARIKSDLQKKQSKKVQDLLSFIPSTEPHLVIVCSQLSDKGHILFLRNSDSLEKSFVIINKASLLHKVIGPMFSPKDFDHHCQLATSTGVVPRSKLAHHFSKFDVDMLIGFMCHLELGISIEDKEVLQLIRQHFLASNNAETPSEDSYLFFPALIRLVAPKNVWQFICTAIYNFAWALRCSNPLKFFDMRFFHVLLLRLALSLGLAPEPDSNIPTLQYHCSVWKTGISWTTSKGIQVLVELVDHKRKIVVLIQSHALSSECLSLRTSVIQRVLQAASELCSSVATYEDLLPSTSLSYPLSSFADCSLYSVKSLAKSVANCDPFVVSVSGTQNILVHELVQGELYSDLGENMLQLISNGGEEKVSDHILSALSISISKIPGMDVVLMKWREESNGTYRSLRETLDTYSVFAGRSPLELAGVPLKPFSEISLPVAEPTSATPTCSPRDKNSDSADRATLLGPTASDFRLTDDQLNGLIQEADLFYLARCFGPWKVYTGNPGLQLTRGEQHTIAADPNLVNNLLKVKDALEVWRNRDPLSATFRNLILILLKLDEQDVAMEISQYINRSRGSPVLQDSD